MKWEFKEIQLEDSDLLFKWRNSEAIYRYLFHPTTVSKAEHEAWIQKTLSNDKVLFLIGAIDGKNAGTVRFDFNPDRAEGEVGIYLAPEYHGQGLSSSMLEQSIKLAQNRFSGLKKIIAKVLPENNISEKMFTRSGFVKKFIQLEKNLKD
jgi:RimJ/RimL family protein N-acetyltransferase